METIDDISILTSKAYKLPNTNRKTDPRFVMYIDPRARRRHSAIQTIAKTIRTKAGNTIQTSLRNGRRDFILRQKTRGDLTPWGQIPPININENIPDFEIGDYINIYNEDIKESEENLDIDKEINVLDPEEEQDISNEILRQYQTTNKRNHSESPNISRHSPKTKKKLTFQPSGTEGDTESDGEPGNHNISTTIKSILHSTAKDEILSSSRMEDQESKTVPETPDVPQIVTRYHSEYTKKTQYHPNNKENQNQFQETAQHHGC